MHDERAFINRVETAGIEEFARILSRPDIEEERALRAHFGDERYRRLHATALRQTARRGSRSPLGNVVVIHGIMGGELTSHKGGAADHIWAKVFALIGGKAARLRLSEDGSSDADPQYQIQASGIMKRSYGEILLELSEHWNVRAFWYDWRKDLALAAADLEAKIRSWFGPDAPLHLVAHSMGGLVARTFIRDYPKRWEKMADDASGSGGRLIMLGTPNHGSFAIPQVITGLEGMVRKLALVDIRHGLNDLLPVFNSFVGSYQMLPSPLAMSDIEWLYKAAAYAPLAVPQAHLDNALKHHESLAKVIDPDRMIYIAGYDQLTFSGFKKKQPSAEDAYFVTLDGDGRVPHALGFLRNVTNYFVKEGHGDLPANDKVISATSELLQTGKTQLLPTTKPATRSAPQRELAHEIWTKQQRDVERFRALAETTRSRARTAAALNEVDPSERELEENLTRGFLPVESDRSSDYGQVEFEPPSIEIVLREGSIADTDSIDGKDLPIDAISVGHYIGVRPQNAESALDLAISTALLNPRERKELARSEGIICQYTDRGVIRGELGQPFFLDDPRAPGARVIALAGMGLPGRFGTPELSVLVRELCWSLGRAGKQHLATVLIGTGVGNIAVVDAVRAWLRGICAALAGTDSESNQTLRRVTFVELDPRRLIEINAAIVAVKEALASQIHVDYKALGKGAQAGLLRSVDAKLKEDARREHIKWTELAEEGLNPSAATTTQLPTRMTVERDREGYRFGAVSQTASVPERTTTLDDALVNQANDELAASGSWDNQREAGQLLGRLLVPTDLKSHFSGDAPIVMTMDSATARIHWEMIAHRERSSGPQANGTDGLLDEFLGTSRGFTRQLRSTFAPPPEPPPPPRRVLRVLIVADPAADAPLPGAQEEGATLAELFRAFNTVHAARTESRIEVKTLLGPTEATRFSVVRELVMNSYDVLHFAGHCVYDKDQPRRSGWIFTNQERLTADELNQIDRVPNFVFSNACESGITRGRVIRSPGLAPSFAEAFFAKGVANFVCTAWRVDDIAASDFALTLYARLLGITVDLDDLGKFGSAAALYLYEAMREARREIACRDYGVHTWGAYQHYGNPYFRFFEASHPRDDTATSMRSGPKKRSGKSKKARKGSRR
jgi:CHAT domain-containing protein/pimeloyl-ACP methyl ester carboxylesterase